jgi:hypothetical protein
MPLQPRRLGSLHVLIRHAHAFDKAHPRDGPSATDFGPLHRREEGEVNAACCLDRFAKNRLAGYHKIQKQQSSLKSAVKGSELAFAPALQVSETALHPLLLAVVAIPRAVCISISEQYQNAAALGGEAHRRHPC